MDKLTWKQLLKEFIPPIVLKIKASKRNRKIKEYTNYYDALRECSTKEVYENSELCAMIGDKIKIYVDYLKQKPYVLNAANMYLVSAMHRFLSGFSVNTIKVLDFGGACGTHYFETRRFFSEGIRFQWLVVETPEMVKSAKAHHFENDELSFIDNLEKIDSSIDFVHSSGALQYVPTIPLICIN